ncbi:MAG: antitoxin MazE family protein [Gemmatimonadetes bacterium]|nr:antitoxin MazE family protein [Gemmatimonadota bacterium]
MSEPNFPDDSPHKVRDDRDGLPRQGLRPIQIWVPDVRAPNFVAEGRRQSLTVARSTRNPETQAFIDSASQLDQE